MEANPTYSDSNLAGAIKQAGTFDPDAMGQVFDGFYPQTYRYIAFRLGEGLETDALCDQVFDYLIEPLSLQLKAAGEVQSWLFITAQTLVDEHIRSAQGESVSIASAFPNEASRLEDEAAWLGRLTRASLVRMVLEQQHLLALRFGCGLSLEDTARIMRRNVSDVKSMQLEALATMRLLMEEEV